MNVEITLGGALIQFLPEGKSGNCFTYSTDAPMSLSALLSQLGVGPNQRLLTILNGQVIHAKSFADTTLCDGDALSLMPPMAAG
ncbi:MAG: MoaD/ThiS family protein [Granulosicoccus sp.]